MGWRAYARPKVIVDMGAEAARVEERGRIGTWIMPAITSTPQFDDLAASRRWMLEEITRAFALPRSITLTLPDAIARVRRIERLIAQEDEAEALCGVAQSGQRAGTPEVAGSNPVPAQPIALRVGPWRLEPVVEMGAPQLTCTAQGDTLTATVRAPVRLTKFRAVREGA